MDHRVVGLCCSESEDMLICTGCDRKIKVFDLRMSRLLQTTTDWEQNYHSSLYYDDQLSRILIGGSQIRTWNVKYIMGEKIDSPFSSIDVMHANKVKVTNDDEEENFDSELQVASLLYDKELHTV